MGLNHCADCGGRLELQGGTDPDRASEQGSFTETYKCLSCTKTGTYSFEYDTNVESTTGVCR